MAGNCENQIRIELLNENNYDTWCMYAEALLVKTGGWEYASGKNIRPIPKYIEEMGSMFDPSFPEREREWDVADEKAKADIILSVSATELKHIKYCSTAKDVWEKLRLVHLPKDPAKMKTALLRRLLSHRLVDGADVRKHIEEFTEVVEKLSHMGIEIHKDLQGAIFYNSLYGTNKKFKRITGSEDELPDLETLKLNALENFLETRKKHS